jgi:hypothetical protein
MNELLSTELWPRLKSLAKHAKKKHAAIGYVTDDKKVRFGKNDVLITDASDEAIKSGQTSAVVLKEAFERKALIYSVSGLHAKVYVFDKYAAIGSANLSLHSEQLIEAALLTDHPTAVSTARLFIEHLKFGAELVDESFIQRICKIRVSPRIKSHFKTRSKLSKDRVSRSWLVGLKPTAESPEEQSYVEEGVAKAEKQVSKQESSVSWIRFRGDSKFRREAQAGDVVVCIWTKDGKATPTCVYHHAPILFRQDDTDTDVTRFYVEEFPDSEQTTLTWKKFQSLFTQIGGAVKPSQWSTREIPANISDALHDLWFDQ